MSERLLYHWPLDPFSRQARLALAERKLKFSTKIVLPQNSPTEFMDLCVEGYPPCLRVVHGDSYHIISSPEAICEYADIYGDTGARTDYALVARAYMHDKSHRMHISKPHIEDKAELAFLRAEIRRLIHWLNVKFHEDVNAYVFAGRLPTSWVAQVFNESMENAGLSQSEKIRCGYHALNLHLEYFNNLLGQRTWFAGAYFSLADIVLASHLSCLDYLGEIKWGQWPDLCTWYQKIKSRLSFRDILADRLAILKPAPHYSDLDF